MAWRLIPLGVLCLVAAVAVAVAGAAAGAQNGDKSPPHPNVVVIESDDQTQASMSEMPLTNQLIGDHGTRFPNNFVNYSLCCPSRSTFLTGQYAHNHGVLNNTEPEGGFDSLDSSSTLPLWLQSNSYYTGLIGKYLNGYEAHRTDVPPLIPPGWSEWHGSTRTYDYYGYELNEGGALNTYGTLNTNPDNPPDPSIYSTDLYTQKAAAFIGSRAPSPQPFFLWLTYLAPHSGGPNPANPPSACAGSAKPAPRDLHAYDTTPLPQPPSFDESDVSDKPTSIQKRPLFDAADISDISRFYRCRLASLKAIDLGVQTVIDSLRASGELDNTLVIYTSDNGFMHGEHRVKSGKVVPYEESIRVPLMVRGPGFPAHTTSADMTSNADLARTILAATGSAPGRTEDGYGLQSFAAHPSRELGRELDIESDAFQAVRTKHYIYIEYTTGPNAGQAELYDLDNDPYELQSQVANPAYAGVLAALRKRLAIVRQCSGAGCRHTPHLRLELDHRDGPAGCARRPVRARLAGADLGSTRLAEFYVNNRRVRIDHGRPFRKTLPFGRLARKRSAAFRLRATLLDGRQMTLDKRIRACR